MSDPSFANVKLLLRMEGADESTTFTDSSSNSATVTGIGNAQIDTDRTLFSLPSALLDGSGDYINAESDIDETQAFTLEAFFRPAGYQTFSGIFQLGNQDNSTKLQLDMRSSGKLNLFAIQSGVTKISDTISAAVALALNTWTHIALVHDGSGGYKVFAGGVSVITASAGSAFSTSNTIQRIASAYISNTAQSFNGNVAQVRFSQEALYTADFTPPAAAFPDSEPSDDAVATATPASISITPGTGTATGQRDATATATPASVSITPGGGVAFGRIPATAIATPAAISITPGTGRGLSGAALGYPTYRVVRDSYRNPIFSRGKVILSRPLSPGQRLAIERKTPITQLVPFTRDEPFSAEGFEYAMDKITFIQQEIEGHACDCRPKDAEDDAEDKYYEENPDCEPYACDSYTKMLDRYEFEKLRGWTLFEDRDDHPTPFSPNSNWQAYYTDGSGVAVWPSATTDSVDVGVSPAIDPCGGEIKRIFRWNSTVSDRTVKLQRVDYSAFNTLSMVIDSATLRSSTLSGTDEFLLLYVARDYKVTRPSGGDLAFRPSVAVRAQRYTPSGGSLLSGMRVRVISDGYTDAWTDLGVIPSGPVQLTVYAVADGAGYNYVPNPPFTASYRFKLVNLEVIVSITPVVGDAVVFEVEATDVQTVNGYFDFGEGPPTFIPQTPIPTARCWALQGAIVDIYELGGLDTVIPVNIDDLVRAFRRNREDYQPPSYCIFPKD